jgi:hypothetical protein
MAIGPADYRYANDEVGKNVRGYESNLVHGLSIAH